MLKNYSIILALYGKKNIETLGNHERGQLELLASLSDFFEHLQRSFCDRPICCDLAEFGLFEIKL